METPELRADGPKLAEATADEAAEPTLVPPPVVALLVTRNPGPWLEEALAGLRDTDYPALTVLVVDGASDDDPTPRVAAVLPGAFVRRLEANVGYAEAANEALSSVEGATFLLLCHDDVALDPGAVRALVEEAYRSNAGILGPKLVDPENPEILREVGFSIDRFGVPVSTVDPGEVDQEQHDSVRDVFFVTSAAMLVRADLFTALGGFDPETWPGAEGLDLCWRARLAGARVLVAPDARARHHSAADARADALGTQADLVLRHRLRALFKAYSPFTLCWVTPLALGLAALESIAFATTRRARGRAP